MSSCLEIFQSPPWNFVEYVNDTMDNSTDTNATDYQIWRVTGGRDHNLLNVIAKKMNFQYKYLDVVERTQGTPDNQSFSGALGMLARRVGLNLFDFEWFWEFG